MSQALFGNPREPQLRRCLDYPIPQVDRPRPASNALMKSMLALLGIALALAGGTNLLHRLRATRDASQPAPGSATDEIRALEVEVAARERVRTDAARYRDASRRHMARERSGSGRIEELCAGLPPEQRADIRRWLLAPKGLEDEFRRRGDAIMKSVLESLVPAELGLDATPFQEMSTLLCTREAELRARDAQAMTVESIRACGDLAPEQVLAKISDDSRRRRLEARREVLDAVAGRWGSEVRARLESILYPDPDLAHEKNLEALDRYLADYHGPMYVSTCIAVAGLDFDLSVERLSPAGVDAWRERIASRARERLSDPAEFLSNLDMFLIGRKERGQTLLKTIEIARMVK